MQVTESKTQSKKRHFAMSELVQAPLCQLEAHTNIAIDSFWKSQKYFWLRLTDEQSGESYDYRIIKIFRFPQASHVVLCPAKRWNLKRRLSECMVLKVLNQKVLSTIDKGELANLQESLNFEESYEAASEDPAYQAVFEDQLTKAFGKYSSFDLQKDIEALAFSIQFAIESSLPAPGQEIEIDLDTTINNPGFLKLKLGSHEMIWRIVAYFEENRKSYLALRHTAEFCEGLEKAAVFVVELKSKTLARTLTEEEFLLLAPSLMDLCESGAKIS